MTIAAVDKEVLHFRKEYKIKKATYPVLSEIAEKTGYTVILFRSFQNDANVDQLINALGFSNDLLKSRGFTYSSGEFRLVFINDGLSDKEKTIVLSHELGHIVLGHVGRAPVIGHDVQEEFEANEFSTFLLKCDSKVFLLFNSRKPAATVICAAVLLAVIAAAVMLSKTPTVPEQNEEDAPSAVGEATEQSPAPDLSGEDFENSELYFQIKTILGANLSAVSPDISYDAENHLINVVCIPPAGTHLALTRNKSAIKENWDTLTESLTGMSDETYKLCLENGYKIGCTVMLIGDDAPDVCLFAALNGMEYCNIGI